MDCGRPRRTILPCDQQISQQLYPTLSLPSTRLRKIDFAKGTDAKSSGPRLARYHLRTKHYVCNAIYGNHVHVGARTHFEALGASNE